MVSPWWWWNAAQKYEKVRCRPDDLSIITIDYVAGKTLLMLLRFNR